MADENAPVPETLQTIAEKIIALGKSMDAQFARVGAQFDQVDARFEQVDARFEQVDRRFEQVDARFEQVDARFEQVDRRFEQVDDRFARVERRVDETRTQLKTEVEALRGDVRLVYDVVIAQADRNERNDADHARFAERLENHDVRILALEPPKRG
ncbi:MAG: hypothetical protein ACRD1V_04985 [Vicinamibacterales bacterium]